MNTTSSLRRRLHIEALEERILLAGNITFIGIQNLAGLGLGTTAVFVGQGTDVDFNVTQNASGDYILEGLNGTTFTIGGVTTDVYTTTAAQTAFMNANNVSLGFSLTELSVGATSDINVGADLTGGFGVRTLPASGDDTLTIGSGITGTGTVNGTLYFDTNGGNDTLTIDDDGDVNGSVNAFLGNGNNTVNILGNGEVGSLNVNAQGGDDIVNIPDGVALLNGVDNNVNLDLGDGNNIVTLGQDIGGSVVINTGSGNDTVTGNGFGDVSGDFTAILGDGTNSVSFQDTFSVDGNAHVEADSGADLLLLQDTSFVGGNLTATLGGGSDTMTLTNFAVVGGDIGADLGDGNDNFNVVGAASVGGDVTTMLGDGFNNTNLGATANVAGDFSAFGGTANDNVNIDGDIGGTLLAHLDGASNTVHIDTNSVIGGDLDVSTGRRYRHRDRRRLRQRQCRRRTRQRHERAESRDGPQQQRHDRRRPELYGGQRLGHR